ncbi:MAG: hypothetical protein KZQ89_13160 [Candidatus Thiodiazotropha sp. (ex Lucinoma kastoroae)]|nr:hypothetical protein [Candidatus Thiodiazotropha sp. (ex Lucinoma kastoroae)]
MLKGFTVKVNDIPIPALVLSVAMFTVSCLFLVKLAVKTHAFLDIFCHIAMIVA